MTPEEQIEVNKKAYDELMELNLDIQNYCADLMKRKDASFTFTKANEIDLGAIIRIRSLLEAEIKR